MLSKLQCANMPRRLNDGKQL